jgi:hypothetical protein
MWLGDRIRPHSSVDLIVPRQVGAMPTYDPGYHIVKTMIRVMILHIL